VVSHRKVAFLDRDGVINEEREYLHRIEDFELVPGAVAGMQDLLGQGFVLAVVTNQSGIGRGYYSVHDYEALTSHMVATLAAAGVQLGAIEYCPHLTDAKVDAYRKACDCRKPAPGMLLTVAKRLQVDLRSSIMVGDKLSDVVAGRAAGVGRCFLVKSGHPLAAADISLADGVYDDLAECAKAVRQAPLISPREDPGRMH
jgi:D-glycero-D-manno-heptose 1,7-bisphosphate phosphatase